MTDRELMQQALDTLELVTDLTNHDDELYEAIEALRARLAQPEPEPVAWMMINKSHPTANLPSLHWKPMTEWHISWEAVPLYTAPPQREWVGLTDNDLDEINGSPMRLEHSGLLSFAHAIEAKLKEKNT